MNKCSYCDLDMMDSRRIDCFCLEPDSVSPFAPRPKPGKSSVSKSEYWNEGDLTLMTTIAVDSNLVMASDSQGTIGDRRVQEPLTKIFNVKNHIVGIAGRYSEAMVFISALEDALEREELQRSTFIPIEGAFIEEMEGFNALVITPKGEVLEYEGSRLYTVAKPPVAIGSGDKYAVAAMACGKSAEEAVEIAKANPIFKDIPTTIEVHPMMPIGG